MRARLTEIEVVQLGWAVRRGSVAERLALHPVGALWPLEEMARQGNEAREALVTANIRYVVYIVRMFSPTNDDVRSDLIQAGTVGLIEAVDTFVPSRGAFSTWAWRRIIGAVRLEAARLSTMLTVSPSRVLAHWRGVDLGDDGALEAALGTLSLEGESLATAPGLGFRDTLVTENVDPGEAAVDAVFQLWLRREVAGLLGSLPDRYAAILRARASGRSQEAVASMLGVSRTRVGQLERAALKELARRIAAV